MISVTELRFIITCVLFALARTDEIFDTDLGEDMNIGLADGGYRKVQLKCGSNSMHITLEAEENFDGVIYTRGHFHNKSSPCFLDTELSQEKGTFNISFALDECNTKKDGSIYSNTLIIQHDKELIMPGDAAFKLECDFNKPRDIVIKANLNSNESVKVISRISLTDADPSGKAGRSKRTLFAEDAAVEITPEIARFEDEL